MINLPPSSEREIEDAAPDASARGRALLDSPAQTTGVPVTSRAEIMQWRKAERQRIVEARLALPIYERRERVASMVGFLDEVLGDVRRQIIALYWPFRGEPNLLRWMRQLDSRGALCALPVVVERHAPLAFRRWRPGTPMRRGIWNIPVPDDGIDVPPDIVVSPVVGFDGARYRLGYGGGFYDRTLAAMQPRPRAIGVGFALGALATIHPLPHDVPMDAIVTEHGKDPSARR